MRVSSITVHGAAGWPGVGLDAQANQLTAIGGPSNSGKSAMAGLMCHVLFGKVDARTGGDLPEGEIIVEGSGGRFRLRRAYDSQRVARLTVAALDHASGGGRSGVDRETARRLVGNMPPTVLAPLCAVSFREGPNLGQLLSKEFALGFQSIQDDGGLHESRRAAELVARRDLLAQELETRIAGERRASGELESRWRELDRLARDQQQHVTSLEQRLQSVEKSLAETDARLRYRRLELNVELRWRADEGQEPETSLTELDSQIEHCRTMIAEAAEREGVVRARLAQVQTAQTGTSAIADQETWLAVSRQLAADLSGEVSRLARASASQNCVCNDAHPRLRPIAETIERQLAVLADSIEDQRRALAATELQGEIDGLTRVQAELRKHLEHLLQRRQAHTFGARSAREDSNGSKLGFSAADAEQLESRRMELEHERFGLVEQVNSAVKKLKLLRGERDALERQRAALLSARSIEHVQRELVAVQQKLERATGASLPSLPYDGVAATSDYPTRASDFLAQLTNGDLVRLALVGQGRQACVVNREGATIAVEHLSAAAKDQVYISLCLTLLSAASRKGVWLPLVLDEPFERLDARATAALAAVLDAFCRQGHQVFVFTRKQDATERLASVGAAVRSIASLRRWQGDATSAFVPTTAEQARQQIPVHMRPVKTKVQLDGSKVVAPRDEVASTEYSVPNTKPARRRKKKPVDRNDAA
jgi:energy-coupling factor transporter ATP-binding protein EcfA2